ncbi:MAG: S41 family peptidase [Acidobacteriota bacterium]
MLKPASHDSNHRFPRRTFLVALLFALLLTPLASPAAADSPDGETLSSVVEALASAVEEGYVFPEVGATMAMKVRQQLAAGSYGGLDWKGLAEALQRDLREVQDDRHLSVSSGDEPYPMEAQEPTPEQIQQWRDRQVRRNFGFEKVERLAGNVGLLELRGFARPEDAGEIAHAAMTFLGQSDALIIDLRHNGGGAPAMVQLLSSYLFDAQPVHLNSLYWRPTDTTQQWWTLAWVPGPRRPEVPVWVLTSQRTFSAAEEFSYNLRQLERATLVGETTGGGAHPGGTQVLHPRLAVWLPTGRAINPITEDNWEGRGVEPHVVVAAEAALDTAYRQALSQLLESPRDERHRQELEEVWGRLEGEKEAE